MNVREIARFLLNVAPPFTMILTATFILLGITEPSDKYTYAMVFIIASYVMIINGRLERLVK